MADELVTAIMLAGVGCLFFFSCHSIARVAYFDRAARSDLLIALCRTAAFLVAIVGCLAFAEALGMGVAAAFAAAWCALSLGASALLSSSWRRREAAERATVAELRVLVERYREVEDSLEARCARAARGYDLTRREEEILALLLEGRTRSEIARELTVSPDTVKTHIRNLYRKTGVAGKAELVEAMAAQS